MLTVSLYRYNPDTDNAPYMQDVQFDTKGKDLMVLDVLESLKAQDPSLAYRRSCREGVCGSDGMNMNGKNGLACITALSETVKNNKLVLRPLPGFITSAVDLALLAQRTLVGDQQMRHTHPGGPRRGHRQLLPDLETAAALDGLRALSKLQLANDLPQLWDEPPGS